MRLDYVEIRDYRSIFLDDGGQPFRIELAHGANTLVGQNNCGKSNVLRAISLAIDPQHRFVSDDDVPGPRSFSFPIITLGFQADDELDSDQAALQAADAYERSFVGRSSPTQASTGRITLRVSFVPTDDEVGFKRAETILLADSGGAAGPESPNLLTEAIEQLRASVRFVLISSGESIESVLEGNFREILHSVVRERLQAEFETAEDSRRSYVTGLQESLLRPLRERLAADVGELFPEISGVGLAPDVLSIEQTLSNVEVSIEDVVATPLDGKGTGVRGGILVAMLSYLALNASRGMVFALEEPEAFLHPGAQEQLRDQLEQLAQVSGVSLVVTTHSPFIMTRSEHGRVFCLAKDRDGRTRISESASGNADHAPLVGGLLRETTIESLLASSSAFPPDAKAILMVEGDGDAFCLRHAAKVVGRPDLLDGIEIRPTGSSTRMIAQAVITDAATDLPLLLLTDNDEPGRQPRRVLAGETFAFSKRQFMNYSELFEANWQNEPVEAEDVFDPQLIEGFVASKGQSIIAGSKKRPDGMFHYDFDQAAKEDLKLWLLSETQPKHVLKWIELILAVRERVGFAAGDESAADIVAVAQEKADEASSDSTHLLTGEALIVTGQHDLARYETSGAIVVDEDIEVPSTVTHVGFYNRGIQKIVPAIVDDHPNRLFNEPTVRQLRSTGRDTDAVVAKLIEDAIRSDSTIAGTSRRVLVLSAPDEPATLVLDQPIRNTKESRGRPLAWTVGPKIIPVGALAQQPSTTSELDEIISKEHADED